MISLKIFYFLYKYFFRYLIFYKDFNFFSIFIHEVDIRENKKPSAHRVRFFHNFHYKLGSIKITLNFEHFSLISIFNL